MSAKSKLITALTLILLAAFLATSLINYAFTRASIRAELLNSALPLTGKNIYSEVHSDMLRPILVSTSMANDAFLKNWIQSGEKDLGAITRYLADLRDKYGFLTTFFVSAASDNYYYQDGILKKIGARDPHDVWYYAFVRKDVEFALDVDTNQAENNQLTIFVNFRVEDEHGRLLGVAGVGLNIDRVTDLLEKARRDYHREVYLVDQDGLVQVHRDKSRIERDYITRDGGIRDVAPAILVPRDDPRSFQYDWDGEHYLLSTRYIPELKWFLIVEQSESSALAAARDNLVRTVAIGLLASILIIVLCTITINHYQGRLERLAKTDPLTGAANRRALDEAFAQFEYKAGRYHAPFSAVILDLDKFKAINDRYGHLAGDNVLKEVAEATRRIIRPSDVLARWGGDEFLILLDGGPEEAEALARRVACALTAEEREIPVTFSHGLARFEEGDTLESMTHRADQAMYRSKNGACPDL
ncbi:diguanylate cyclase [Pseudodesulfovibrio mercurii]|uniref:diguanylate cyclase n=1 Tax=Pseudodesulfovibrio mercurii TaxID=641491 RepID=F0JJ62_9BACT|nr:sensor domain-containing diguanylate cyclase [Pseudodesulfovibrio mercurii]EGB15961.1 diguanylate cyclase [Pseudodesulfovibrio mercurii]